MVHNVYDREGLTKWLRGRRREISALISLRAVLRVAPVAWERENWDRDLGPRISITIFRRALVAQLFVHDAKKFAHLPLALKNNHALDVVAHAAEGDHDNRTGQAVGQIMRASRNMLDAADAAEDLAIVSEVLGVVEGISVTISYDPSILGPEAHADIRMFETAPPSFDKPLWQSGDLAPEGWLSAKNWWRKRGTAWEFWIKWYEDLLAGVEPDWALLEKVALIPDEIWKQGIAAVNVEIETLIRGKDRTPLAAAALFDFIEANRKMRMVGYEADLSHLREDATVRLFCDDTLELRDDLADWRDYAADKGGQSNAPSVVVGVVEKLIAELGRVDRQGEIRARRLVTLGSDLRRFSVDGAIREELGNTLSEMLDERVDRFAEVSSTYLAPVLSRLEPLNRLQLGNHDPTTLVSGLRAAVERAKRAVPEDLADLEPGSRAVLDEMIRELDELGAGISEARSPNAAEILKQRFAARYGGVSATFGRYIEKAKIASGSSANKFDNAVKWYKRWKTIEKIIDWCQTLGTPPPGP